MPGNCKSEVKIFKEGNEISTMGILQDQVPFHKTVHHNEPQADNISQKETSTTGVEREEEEQRGIGAILKDI